MEEVSWFDPVSVKAEIQTECEVVHDCFERVISTTFGIYL